MASTERGSSFHRTRRESHHQQGACGFFLRIGGRGCSHIHHQLSKVLLIQGNPVGRFIAAIGFGAELPTDCNLRGETHDSHPDFVADQRSYRLVDITGVGRKERSKYEEDLPSAVTRCMAASISQLSSSCTPCGREDIQKSPTCHLQSILETGQSLRILRFEILNSCEMFRGVSTHVTDSQRKTISQAQDTQLGDRILLEEFSHKFLRISEGQ